MSVPIHPNTPVDPSKYNSIDDMFDKAVQNKQRVGDMRNGSSNNSYDLTRVNFSKVEGYGANHAQRTQRLAEYIARNVYKLPPDETRIVGLAAIMHDLGRTQPFHGEDPGHHREGLTLAHEALTVDAEFAKYVKLHERVLRLLAQHDLSGRQPSDPLACALWDADSLESLRHAPNTSAGEAHAKKRLARVVTPWAKLFRVQEHYAKFCGWLSWHG